MQTGLIMTLQTDKNHFGKGYGELVTKALAKQIAEMGHDLYTGVFPDNKPSITLFRKLGFEQIGKVHWVCTKLNWTDADD